VVIWYETLRMRVRATPDFRRKAIATVKVTSVFFAAIAILTLAISIAIGVNRLFDPWHLVVIICAAAGGAIIGLLLVVFPRLHRLSADYVDVGGSRYRPSPTYDTIIVQELAPDLRRISLMDGHRIVYTALAKPETVEAIERMRAERAAKQAEELRQLRGNTAVLQAATVATLPGSPPRE
jgi:hypothetical protein